MAPTTQAKKVTEPAEAVRSGISEVQEQERAGKVTPGPTPPPSAPPPAEAKPVFDHNDPQAAPPGEKPVWPNDFLTFTRLETTPKELVLKDGGKFVFELEQLSTANRFLAEKLLALNPALGVRRVPNPKENPYARK